MNSARDVQYYVVKFLQCTGFGEEVAGFVSNMKPAVLARAWFMCLLFQNSHYSFRTRVAELLIKQLVAVWTLGVLLSLPNVFGFVARPASHRMGTWGRAA